MKTTSKYNHQEVEAKWSGIWRDNKLDQAAISEAQKPFYNLMMFPYPSAEGLHVGNMYAFTGSDVHGRFKRMQGYDVFEPIGLDGFGIHSENYALKVGAHPLDQAAKSQANFYRQLSQIGCMFDWSRTLETYDPAYYRWTQWLFVQMFRHGLAYRGRAEVNWCPSCKTVLADEQVIDGKCERCGNIVEKRLLEQWFFRITAYAGKLLENSFSLDWSEKVKISQQNWIGKKEGINITYDVVDDDRKIGEITCFTTRPDTNFGATFVVIAPEHPFLAEITSLVPKEKRIEIEAYIAQATKKSMEDRIADGRKKTGVATGLYCVNSLNNKKMHLYISDFVVMGFGTGAVVGVPGHDKRDFEFAQVMKIPVERVVVGPDGDTTPITKIEQVQEDEGKMINSEFLNGKNINDAVEAMKAHLEAKGWGKRVVIYHLRDWLISRQRYWGPPIPMIYCRTCADVGKGERSDMPGWYTVPETDLPVALPRIDDYKPGDDGIAPLAKHKEFYETTCPGCGASAVRETDVSDTFLDSSWYFLRYPTLGSPKADLSAFDPAITKRWLPVHMYTGGAEHSVLHLMYSRFITMALHDWGYIDFDEPFARFFAHGLVIKDGVKMSKSKGNVVNPDEYIRQYGADALRLYLMFMGPYSDGGDFRDSSMEGMSRWVGRIWRLAEVVMEKQVKVSHPAVASGLAKLVRRVTDDLEKRRYNTAIAAMMEFTNAVSDQDNALSLADLQTFLHLLGPFAPFLTEELWQMSSGKESIHRQQWPQVDETKIMEESLQMVVQINGKLRDSFVVSVQESQDQAAVEAKARGGENVKKYVASANVKKVIFVPGKLINFVV